MKNFLLLFLISLSLNAYAEKTPFGYIEDKVTPILDQVSSAGASRMIELSKCNKNFNQRREHLNVMKKFQFFINKNVEADQYNSAYKYVIDSYERKMRALKIAYSDKKCSDTSNLNFYAQHFGF